MTTTDTDFVIPIDEPINSQTDVTFFIDDAEIVSIGLYATTYYDLKPTQEARNSLRTLIGERAENGVYFWTIAPRKYGYGATKDWILNFTDGILTQDLLCVLNATQKARAAAKIVKVLRAHLAKPRNKNNPRSNEVLRYPTWKNWKRYPTWKNWKNWFALGFLAVVVLVY